MDLQGVAGSKSARDLSRDPEYSSFHKATVNNAGRREEFLKKEETVRKIKSVLREQFTLEIRLKEQELMKIDQRIHQAREMLDRLRAYILAGYFGSGGTILPVVSTLPVKQRKQDRSREMYDFNEEDESTTGTSASKSQFSNSQEVYSLDIKKGSGIKFQRSEGLSETDENTKTLTRREGMQNSNRFYVKRSVIIGNVSKYIPIDRREKNDQSSHKWMVYLRGPKNNPDVSKFIKKVIFFLHPSYIPNDIVEISKPPFQLTRRGWGEFPIRLQLYFVDSRNKKVDVLHNLKLDKTYTGLQTLGSESVIDLHLHRHAVLDTESQQETSDLKRLSARGYRESETNRTYSSTISGQVMASASKRPSRPITPDMSASKDTETIPLNYDGLDPQFRLLQGLGCQGATPSERDTSYACSDFSSRIVSRATSPVLIENGEKSRVFLCSTDVLLGKFVESTPLVKAGRDRAVLPFAARSVNEYRQWSFSKRRAAEWQRAAQIKRELSKISEDQFDMSTKEIMLWCRNAGYTPPESHMNVCDTSVVDFCPACGKVFVAEKEDVAYLSWCSQCAGKPNPRGVDTLSSSKTLMDSVIMKDSILKKLGRFSLRRELGSVETADEDIDVVGNPLVSSDYESQSECGNNNSETLGSLIEIPSSPEMDWIYDCVSQLGIHLPAMYENGYRIPVLQGMLLASLKEFIKDLLRVSYRQGKRKLKSSEPLIVTATHLHGAIRTTDRFDFLGTRHFALEEEDGSETDAVRNA